jgi:pimeloyl-ACP methyl ester carboxylesterase
MTWRIERRFGVNFASLDGPAIARTTALPPVLIAHDEDDVDVPLVHASTLAEAWPGAKLMVTSGLGHRAILRDAEVVQSLVRFVDLRG